MKKIKLKRTSEDRFNERLRSDLNESQRTAASAPDGYHLILAGPGSGKTRVITYRVAHLISRGVPARSILLVTFTRRAAREMTVRLEGLVGPTASEVWAGTFHHVGNRLLRRSAERLGLQPNFTILDGEDQSDLFRLAMTDAGVFGTGKAGPKPATVQHLISYAVNVGRPLEEVVADRAPDLAEWVPQFEEAARAYAARKLAANCLDYDDLLTGWLRLIKEHPDQLQAQGRMFEHILIDEMQDTNHIQVEVVEAVAAAGKGNLTAVGDDAQSIYRFRGADYDNILKFQERHPTATIHRLEQNYRSTPEIVAFTNASISHNQTGFPKTLVSTRQPGVLPVVLPTQDAYEEAEFVCQQILECHDEGTPLARMAVLYRNHHDSVVLQGELVGRGINYSVRSGVRFFEQAHIKDVLAYLRIVVNPRDEPAWRRLLVLLPGIGQVKASTLCSTIVAASDPHAIAASSEVMSLVPSKSRGFYAGFVADVRKVQAVDPEKNPADAVEAVLQGGYPGVVRTRYERPENRIADIEQLAVLAGRYDSLERLIAELLLAGDVYGVDTIGDEAAEDALVLSTVHQAKGLEWSRVFVIRLLDDGFPHYRALAEPGGEEEERRIFYVAVTRAMDELYLSYPLTSPRGSRGPFTINRPSRFLTEIPQTLYESAVVER
ncbi:MAG: ATP-dependent helicase [Isosphaeraceae bacterium]